MPNDRKTKSSFELLADDMAVSYFNRRIVPPETLTDNFFKEQARPKLPGDPELRKLFSKKAMELVAEGYDKDDVESEWGINAGVLPVMYEPADLIADVMTFGLTTAGRQAIRLGAKAAVKGERELLEQTGKYFARETAREVGFGAMAGASMFLAEELGAGPIVEMMSGLVGPTATMGICTLGRKGFSTWMRRLSQNNPDLHARILREAENLPDNEFARVVREIEAPGGPPWKPEKLGIEANWKEFEMASPEDYIVLYHGTSEEAAQNIIEKGFDISAKTINARKQEGVFLSATEHIGTYAAQAGKPAIVKVRVKKKNLLPDLDDWKGKPNPTIEEVYKELGQVRVLNPNEIEVLDVGIFGEKLYPTWRGTEPPKLPKAKVEPEKIKAEELEKAWITAMGDPNKPIIVSRKAEPEIETWKRFTLEERPERAININLAKFETSDDIKDALVKTAKLFEPEIQKLRRGTITLKQQEGLADKLGFSVEQLINRRMGKAFNAEEIIAAGKLLDSSAMNLVELAEKASGVMATDLDKLAFRKAFNLHYALQAQFSGMEAEAGRALGAFRTVFEGAGRTQQIKEFLEQIEGAVPIQKTAALIATLPTTKAVTTTIRKAQKANTWDMFLEAWINGLLSGPQTHAVNTGSNMLFALWQIPERYLAAGISKVTPGPQEIRAGEAAAQAWGMIEGFRDGLKMAGRALKEAEGIDPLSKIEARRYRTITAENMNLDPAGPAGRTADFLGETVRLPGRFLVAEDEFFKGMGYRMELQAQAFRQASMEGLEGKDFAKRTWEIVNDPPENIRLAAQNAARYQTYTNELGKAGKAFQQILRDIPALRLIVPFFRTGTNIAKAVQERTPLAFLSKRFMAEISAGGARRDIALARLSMGSMMMATFATLASAGYITGAGPPDKSARQSLRNMGWQSYSFCTNPDEPIENRKYVRFSRIDPFGAFLGLAADAVEIMAYADEVTTDQIAAMCSMAIAENVSSKTWIKGVTDFIEAWSDPKRYMTNYLERMAGTVIPTMAATVERTIHPQFSEVNSWLDAVKSRTPGLSKDLPPRLNLWGEPIIGGTIRGDEGNWHWLPVDMINPLYVSKGKRSPIDKEIYRNAISVGMPAKNIGGVKLTDEEYHRYVELQGKIVKHEITGKNLKDTLDFLVEHPAKAQALGLTTLRYDKMSDGPEGYKAVTIKRIIQNMREKAQWQLRQEFPELDRFIDDLRMEKMEEIAGGMQ